jgi:uncharacterized membrane protein
VEEGGADVIIAISTPAALAAYKATQVIPIIALAAVDPVASGLAEPCSSRSQRNRHRGVFGGNLCKACQADEGGCSARGPPGNGNNKGQ